MLQRLVGWLHFQQRDRRPLRDHADVMRKAGASAREMLVAAAASAWSVPSGECKVTQGRVQHQASARSGSIGEFAAAAARLPVPSAPTFKPASEYTLIGRATPRKDTPMLCTNPLNGGAKPAALMEANLGTLKPDDKLETGALIVGAVPARCDGKGFLLIGDPPEIGPYVLPGNNYHVYDFPLFWANVRADATWRLKKYLQK